LLVGWEDASPDTFYVNDPGLCVVVLLFVRCFVPSALWFRLLSLSSSLCTGFDQETYTYDDIADIIVYTILPTNGDDVKRPELPPVSVAICIYRCYWPPLLIPLSFCVLSQDVRKGGVVGYRSIAALFGKDKQ
jgi:hypothetical protein